MKTQTAKVFDAHAADYDGVFTNTSIGIRQRAKVYSRVEAIFLDEGASVLEINCGTGEDAHYFISKGVTWLPTDISKNMVHQANLKLKDQNAETIDAHAAIEKYGKYHNTIFSNFGGLNCLNDNELSNLFELSSRQQNPNSRFIAVIMPKFCFMEGLYHLSAFKWRKLFRRANKNGLLVNVQGSKVHTFYHRPSRVKAHLIKNDYDIELVKPIAVAIPPSYLSNKLTDGSILLRIFDALDRLLCRISGLSGVSDHFIIIAKKK